MTRKLLALLIIAPALASAQSVQASRQQVVNSLSLQSEFDQYRALSQSLEMETRYEVAQRKFTQAKMALERAKKLVKAGIITESKFALVYYEYRQIEADVITLPIEIAKAKLTAEFHQWRVLELGNPGVHHESEMVELMIKGLDSELETLNTSKELAITARNIAETYWQHGQRLSSKKVISSEQQELRETAYHNSNTLLKGIEKQIDLVKIARASLQESRIRVQNGGNGANF